MQAMELLAQCPEKEETESTYGTLSKENLDTIKGVEPTLSDCLVDNGEKNLKNLLPTK